MKVELNIRNTSKIVYPYVVYAEQRTVLYGTGGSTRTEQRLTSGLWRSGTDSWWR
jgi:hypothetical protein